MTRWTVALAAAALFACQVEVARELGPTDGFDLSATELERVAVGDTAPLFALQSFHGDTVGLEDFRGDKNVILVFYRGHW